MRAYYRATPRCGVSLPFWLAIPVGLIALVIWLAIVIYGTIAMLILLGVRAGRRSWRAHHPS